MAIRFFYSSQQSLSSAKLSLYCHKRTKIVLMKNELQLDFCMGIPLNHLIKLADFYNVSTDFLLGRVTYKHNLISLNDLLFDNITYGDLLNKVSTLDKYDLLIYSQSLK